MMCMQSKELVKVNNFRRVEAEYETLRQEMDHSMDHGKLQSKDPGNEG